MFETKQFNEAILAVSTLSQLEFCNRTAALQTFTSQSRTSKTLPILPVSGREKSQCDNKITDDRLTVMEVRNVICSAYESTRPNMEELPLCSTVNTAAANADSAPSVSRRTLNHLCDMFVYLRDGQGLHFKVVLGVACVFVPSQAVLDAILSRGLGQDFSTLPHLLLCRRITPMWFKEALLDSDF